MDMMDSTTLTPQLQASRTSKLPIKRKTPDPNPPTQPDPKPPPFKFHRIWTEPDEIRFLHGLLQCASHNLSFPRDLPVFYARFSGTMSQPYTKSQLSEKLRRLRKKFRIISTRISKGFDQSLLSLHDRALYDLSKRLWHSDYAATSPFNGARNVGPVDSKGARSGLVGVKVDFSPTLPVIGSGFDDDDDDLIDDGVGAGPGSISTNGDEEVKLSEVNVEFEGGEVEEEGIGEVKVAAVGRNVGDEDNVRAVAAKAAIDVFEECFNDVRRRVGLGRAASVGSESFEMRWQQQKVTELDVLGGRLRLVLEHCLGKE